MSVILNNAQVMSLYEANKRAGYDRNEGFLLEIQKKHQALDVLSFLPSSDGSFHKYNKASLLGKGTWRDLNEGRTPTFGTMESVTTPVQLFSTESNVSDDILQTCNSPSDVRDSENLLVAKGLVDDFMEALITSDGSDDKKMKGFMYYRGAKGDYCLNGLTTGDTTSTSTFTSLFLCELGEYGVNIRYNPKLTGGSDGIGLKIKDEGAVWMNDANNKHMKVWKTTYDLTAGLEVRQDNALIRIANVNPKKDFNTDVFIDALQLLPNGGDNAVVFCPRSIYAQLMKFAFNSVSGTGNFSVEEFENFGKVLKVFGVPFIREDAIPTDQAKMTF